jgi:hypothetical protein
MKFRRSSQCSQNPDVLPRPQPTEKMLCNITCQLSSLLAMKEIDSAFRIIFNRRFRLLLFYHFSNRVMGTSQSWYRIFVVMCIVMFLSVNRGYLF